MDTHYTRPAANARRLLGSVLLASAAMAGHAHAQTGTPAPIEREPVGTLEQKTERIVHQDAGSRVEELQVGGQTRSIDVVTNSRVPGYQVQPIDPAQNKDDRGAAGKSSWRVLNF